MEEYLDKLNKAKDIEDTKHDYERVIDQNQNQDQVRNCKKSLKELEVVKNGNRIFTNKEFKLVFFITSFLPFVRPNVPNLKPSEIDECKRESKAIMQLFLDEQTNDGNNQYNFFDYDFYNESREIMRDLYRNKNEIQFSEKSMFLKMHQEKERKKAKMQDAFCNSFAVPSPTSKSYAFWQ